jgi:hypothetical protein
MTSVATMNHHNQCRWKSLEGAVGTTVGGVMHGN